MGLLDVKFQNGTLTLLNWMEPMEQIEQYE